MTLPSSKTEEDELLDRMHEHDAIAFQAAQAINAAMDAEDESRVSPEMITEALAAVNLEIIRIPTEFSR